jgi:hypothetical protein
VALIERIDRYHRVIFPTAEAAQHASQMLMDFVTATPTTIATMVGPQRVVMWDESVSFDSKTLYLSPGALTILSRLVPLPDATVVAPSDLPANRAMLLGDASDWSN